MKLPLNVSCFLPSDAVFAGTLSGTKVSTHGSACLVTKQTRGFLLLSACVGVCVSVCVMDFLSRLFAVRVPSPTRWMRRPVTPKHLSIKIIFTQLTYNGSR